MVALMPIFYFHVRHRDTRYDDTHGIEMHDIQAAWDHAHRDARSIADAGLLAGSPDEQWMEIEDETGTVVATLPFRKVLATN